MQYAVVVAVVCFMGYLIAGFVKVWWIVLAISLAMLFIVLSFMRKYTDGKDESKEEARAVDAAK